MEDVPVHQVAATVRDWLGAGHQVAFARVIERTGFSGDTEVELLACNEAGQATGNLLRGTVVESSLTVLHALLADPSAASTVLAAHVKMDQAIGAGLSCGGSAQVLVQRTDSVPAVLWSALADRHPAVLATGLDGAAGSMVLLPDHAPAGSLGDPAQDEAVAARAAKLLDGLQAGTETLTTPGGAVLLEAWVPEPHLIVAGDGALADALVAQSELLGWSARLAGDLDTIAAALQEAGNSAALVVLSHDLELGPGALYLALKADPFYVGALGSRKTQANRTTRLKDLGASDEELTAIHGPIGLDLGGRSPAQLALAICAEILAVRTGRRGVQLRATEGSIRGRHH